MPLIEQKIITRNDLRANPDWLFVFGDNLAGIGGATGNPRAGQAGACRGEPNAIGIPTKRRPSMDEDAFFTDDRDYSNAMMAIRRSFVAINRHLMNGGTVVWPEDGIGTGRAELERRAPLIWQYLQTCIDVMRVGAGAIATTGESE